MEQKKHYQSFILKLKECGINPADVYLHSSGYINGVYECANQVLKFIPSGKVVEYGCGTGLMIDYLSNCGLDAYGFDIKNHEENLELFKGNHIQEKLCEKLKAYFIFDIDKLKQNKFDGVILNASYEHFDNRLIEIENIKQILKKDGYVFIFRCPHPKSYSERITKSHKNLIDLETIKKEFKDFKLITWWFSDFMIWSTPFQGLYNIFFPLTNLIDKISLKTSIKKYSHNINCILKLK